MMNIAVLVSGEGTTLQHLIDYSKKNPNIFQIKAVGSDRKCNGINRALKSDIPIIFWRDVYSQEVDFICLAGFLRKVDTPTDWQNKIINIHPALLPAFGGKDMYGMKVHQAVHKSKAWYTGCTIHLCDNEYDHGPILYQEMTKIDPDWSPEDISTAVQKIEKAAYVKVLKAISLISNSGYSTKNICQENNLREKLNDQQRMD